MPEAFDAAGRSVRFGRELGRGGEGTVWEITGDPTRVAKLYAKPPDRTHAEKLAAMIGMAEERLLRIAAWPTATLHDAKGAVIGFVMPRIDGHKPVFHLYGPKLRLQAYPKADWAFLIHAAANAARAFAVVHAAGHVIGDVNFSNLVVGADATVRLIDCDSFQVRRGGVTWFCRVGVGTHQPPELQGLASYDGVLRTPNHDRFGLAVIIFQLLCLGRHPFAGRFLGRGDPPPIEQAIAEGRYAYGRDQGRTMMAPPAGSLPIDALSPRIATLFERAFALASKAGGRPAAEEWVEALGELGGALAPCAVNRGHVFRRGLSTCPWCAIEAASGVPIFPGIFVTAGGTGDFLALWQQVKAVPLPKRVEPPAVPPVPEVSPSPDVRAAEEKARRYRVGSYASVFLALLVTVSVARPNAEALLGLGIVGAAFWLWSAIDRDTAVEALKARVAELEREWAAAVEAAKTVAALSDLGKLPWQIDELKTKLLNLKPPYDALAAERARRLQGLAESARERQRDAYLGGFPIAQARIQGIGRAKVATLSAWGIDTAADVDAGRIAAIPGFGPVLIKRLMVWRREVEKGFVFDATRGPDPASLAQVEREIAQERARLLAELSSGLARLQALVRSAEERVRAAETRRNEVLRWFADLAPRLAQARADARAAPTDLRASKARIVLGVVVSLVALAGSAVPQHMPPRAPPPSVQAPAWVAQRPPEPPPPPAPVASPMTPVLAPVASPTTPAIAPSPPAPVEGPPPPAPAPSLPLAVDEHAPLDRVPELDPPRLPPLVSSQSPPSGPQPPQPNAQRETSPAARSSTATRERVATRQGANVREAPRGDAPIVRVAPQGTTLSVFGRSGNWVQVGEDAPWGWVHASLLEPRAP